MLHNDKHRVCTYIVPFGPLVPPTSPFLCHSILFQKWETVIEKISIRNIHFVGINFLLNKFHSNSIQLIPTVKINQLPNFFCQQYFESRLYTRLSRTSYYENSPSKYFFSYEPLHARKRRIFFYRRATYKGTYVEAAELAKEGEKVAPAKARFRVPFTKKFPFWFTSIWVLRDPSRLNIGSYET